MPPPATTLVALPEIVLFFTARFVSVRAAMPPPKFLAVLLTMVQLVIVAGGAYMYVPPTSSLDVLREIVLLVMVVAVSNRRMPPPSSPDELPEIVVLSMFSVPRYLMRMPPPWPRAVLPVIVERTTVSTRSVADMAGASKLIPPPWLL